EAAANTISGSRWLSAASAGRLSSAAAKKNSVHRRARDLITCMLPGAWKPACAALTSRIAPGDCDEPAQDHLARRFRYRPFHRAGQGRVAREDARFRFFVAGRARAGHELSPRVAAA